MPSTFIKNIGEVEYTSKALPAGIKGKAVIGVLEAPILISEQLAPGTKLDYVVAHEVGHRLTLDMIENAYEDSPSSFKNSPSGSTGLIRYFIDLGLKKDDLEPLHPGIRAARDSIFDDYAFGRYPDEESAREFIAEVYANWATGHGHIPPTIAKRFRQLTDSKNAVLGLKGSSASLAIPHEDSHITWFIIGIAASIAVAVMLSQDNSQVAA